MVLVFALRAHIEPENTGHFSFAYNYVEVKCTDKFVTVPIFSEP